MYYFELFLIFNLFSSVLTVNRDNCSNISLTENVSGPFVKLCRAPFDATISDVTDHIHFLLFSRGNRIVAQEMLVGEDATIGLFNGSKQTKVVVHGFAEDRTYQWLSDARDAFLDKGDFNVIVVDWGDLAKAPDYAMAVVYTKVVGNDLGQLLDWLNLVHRSASENLHLIGFSLGAHVVGFAGSAISTGKPGRITGLDPAYPFFEAADESERLDKSDGKFVDVIHTNSGPLLEGGLSFLDPIGHVDFYPNGGRRQPECKNLLESIQDVFVSGFDGACSHKRAPDLYVESIVNPTAFPGYPCTDYDTYLETRCTSCNTSCPLMGENVASGTSGIYYLSTRSTRPFHGKPLFVQFRLSNDSEPTFGWLHLNVTDGSGLVDNPLLLNEQQEIGSSLVTSTAGNILLEIDRDLTTGTLNFTQHSGGSVMRIDEIKVYDQLANKR